MTAAAQVADRCPSNNCTSTNTAKLLIIAIYTIPELLNNLTRIQYDQRIFFSDANWQQWYVEVEENWDEDSDEYFFSAKVQHWDNCYIYAQNVGETISEAIMNCLAELQLIAADEVANI